MVIKLLTKEQRSKVFSQYMVRHFHKSELKPISEIEKLISEDKYACYGLYNKKSDEFRGYAYFAKKNGKQVLLLDYLAVLKSYRSLGIGSKFIKIMKKSFQGEYKAVLAEVENPDYAKNDKERNLRKRRIKFYQRNGLCLSNVLSGIAENEYRIMVLNLEKPLEDKNIITELNMIYKATMPLDLKINLRLSDK